MNYDNCGGVALCDIRDEMKRDLISFLDKVRASFNRIRENVDLGVAPALGYRLGGIVSRIANVIEAFGNAELLWCDYDPSRARGELDELREKKGGGGGGTMNDAKPKVKRLSYEEWCVFYSY